MNDNSSLTELAQGETPPWAAGTDGREQEMYPTLDAAEIAQLMPLGEERNYDDGATVWKEGEVGGFFLILQGQVDVLRRDGSTEHLLVSHSPGQYVGELTTMTGARALVAGRAVGNTRALFLAPAQVRQVIAREADLGEKILLSFILRRMRLIAGRFGSTALIGDTDTPETATLQQFMSRNGLPFSVLHPDRDAEAVQAQLEHIGETAGQWPCVISRGCLLRQPSIRELAEHMGITVRLDCGVTYDVAVVGSGPAGLAAAVYAASEGLSVVVLENCAPGGQAASSSKIENYVGFPTGISGQGLMGRAYLQAQKFGAQIALARELISLEAGSDWHKLHLDGGDTLFARAVVIASGAIYRQPVIADIERFGGVHYGASHIEGELCRGKDVAIIGGGNSAGQAAVYISGRARHVHILIRGESLGSSMSDYLIQRIERLPNVTVHNHSEVKALSGEQAMQSATIFNNQTNTNSELPISHLFIFIGAQAGTGFVPPELLLDKKGFALTGEDLSADALTQSGWPMQRKPHKLETSIPRVFAVGDVRANSVKRVASAVGEGSVCIAAVHSTLAELEAASE